MFEHLKSLKRLRQIIVHRLRMNPQALVLQRSPRLPVRLGGDTKVPAGEGNPFRCLQRHYRRESIEIMFGGLIPGVLSSAVFTEVVGKDLNFPASAFSIAVGSGSGGYGLQGEGEDDRASGEGGEMHDLVSFVGMFDAEF